MVIDGAAFRFIKENLGRRLLLVLRRRLSGVGAEAKMSLSSDIRVSCGKLRAIINCKLVERNGNTVILSSQTAKCDTINYRQTVECTVNLYCYGQGIFSFSSYENGLTEAAYDIMGPLLKSVI
ncbi:unnamed protein product [Dovyalis caffra]|uniref:Uncharacterized protein n=1 Tax=Dovyalis caffra TaxID=77055 RepID=A0AAV1S007_9ROSI|nr:unnamed protein product [Dovyalis caffra]